MKNWIKHQTFKRWHKRHGTYTSAADEEGMTKEFLQQALKKDKERVFIAGIEERRILVNGKDWVPLWRHLTM